MNDLTTQDQAPPVTMRSATSGILDAFVPRNIDEAFRIAKALSLSGDMVPKHFQGKPEMIMAAMARGAEVGLPTMQALSSITVINGRASIWGDAIPALLQSRGHTIDSWIEGEGDGMVAVAEVTRGDTGKVYRRTFSVADAKAAGLWGKPGPWQNYKRRMLEIRARTYAARDGAADALMGLQVAEEMQDVPVRDITPQPQRQNLAQRLQSRTESAAPLSGEVMPPETQEAPPTASAEAHWAEAYDEFEDGTPGSVAFDEGARAFNEGKPRSACPYDEGTEDGADWLGAWLQARRAAE